MKGQQPLCTAVNKLSILCKPWDSRDEDTGWTTEEVFFVAREGQKFLILS